MIKLSTMILSVWSCNGKSISDEIVNLKTIRMKKSWEYSYKNVIIKQSTIRILNYKYNKKTPII